MKHRTLRMVMQERDALTGTIECAEMEIDMSLVRDCRFNYLESMVGELEVFFEDKNKPDEPEPIVNS